ncbi:MAG: aldehyde dehydrogenase EutE [Maledivibacter sp.]|nr:aldehyde dehydrogenase EutE [Maledivibacter sp.]
MSMAINQIEEIIKKVMCEINEQTTKKNTLCEDNLGVYEDINDAIEAAWIAKQKFSKYSLGDRTRIIKSIKNEINENIEYISRMSVEETGMGRYEHKILKNKLVIEKTPGVEDLKSEVFTGDGGLTLIEYSPYGVIGAIAPSTNPTETIICNCIGMIAAGNSIVFGPHPGAKDVSVKTVEIINKAIEKANGPKNLVTTIRNPTIEKAQILMKHGKIDMVCATGGPGVVKAAMSSGKKTIGAGAGNPPAVVDSTANIEKAAKDIIDGCGFDNNLPCIAEKEVIALDGIADYLMFCMKKNNAYEIKDTTIIDKLEKLILKENGEPNREFVGKNADYILKSIGIDCNEDIKVIIAEVDKDHSFVMEELMMPVLPIVRVMDIDEAIELAIRVEHGNRHTAIMHSQNVDNLTRLARAIQTTIFVKNGPSYSGIGYGAEGYTTFTIAGPTGEGLTSARAFSRKRRCVLVEGFSIK